MNRITALVAVTALPAAALLSCHEAPTELVEIADANAPNHAHQPGHGGGPPGRDEADFFPVIMVFRDAASDNIRSDDEVRADPLYTGPEYADGVCGVLANLGNFADARLNPDGEYRGQARKNCGDPRALVFEFDDPDDGGDPKPTRIDGIFMNIDHVETVTGTDEPRRGQFNLCNRMFFDPNDGEFPNNGSDSLLVSFDDGGTPADSTDDIWTVRTQDPPNDKAFCKGDQRLWHMPFELTIRRQVNGGS